MAQANAVPNARPTSAQGARGMRRATTHATAAEARPTTSPVTGRLSSASRVHEYAEGPRRIGICATMVRTATPSMKPATTGSGTKLVIDPRRISANAILQGAGQRHAQRCEYQDRLDVETVRAAQAGIGGKRCHEPGKDQRGRDARPAARNHAAADGRRHRATDDRRYERGSDPEAAAVRTQGGECEQAKRKQNSERDDR